MFVLTATQNKNRLRNNAHNIWVFKAGRLWSNQWDLEGWTMPATGVQSFRITVLKMWSRIVSVLH